MTDPLFYLFLIFDIFLNTCSIILNHLHMFRSKNNRSSDAVRGVEKYAILDFPGNVSEINVLLSCQDCSIRRCPIFKRFRKSGGRVCHKFCKLRTVAVQQR